MADRITYEYVTIAGEGIEPGLLIWRRYRVPYPGVLEIFLDINPQLREHLAVDPRLPVGMAVIIPIIDSVINRRASSQPTQRIWGTSTPAV